MKRLTVFDGEFWLHKDFPPVREDTVDEFVDCVKDMASRLASIENILGDDYDLDRLEELVQADREERCVVHPLKSDDEVYIILLSRVFLFEVTSAVWYRESPIYKAMHGIHLCYVFNQDDIGKTVFLTREEAEATLKKMRGKI